MKPYSITITGESLTVVKCYPEWNIIHGVTGNSSLFSIPSKNGVPMATKIVIVVRGGNVQDCYADLKTVDIEMIDFDNIKAEGYAAEQQAEARVTEVAQT